MTDYNVASKSPKSVKIDSSSTNIPSGFSTAAGSLVLTGIARADVLTIINETQSRIAVNYTTASTSSAPTLVDAYVPAAAASSFAGLALDSCQIASNIYIKSDTGSAISSGVVTVSVG